MKRSRILNLMVVALAVVLVATGCKHKGVGVTDLPNRKITFTPNGKNTETERGPSVPTGDNVSGSQGTIPTDISQSGGKLLNDPNHREDRDVLAAQTVYFDLDSATVKSSESSKVQEVAKYLQSNLANEVMIEGHCDERGTEGYNLSLGERRALAIREALINLGASPDRVHTISYGESRPADQGNNESAWKKNRRGEFLVLMPAQ